MPIPVTDIKTLRQRVEAQADLKNTRLSIAEWMLCLLAQQDRPLDDLERLHLTQAVDSFSLNVYAVQQPTFAWLRLCLQDLEAAIARTKHGADSAPPHTWDAKILSSDELIAVIEAIRKVI
jgi:hypothetical protein